MEKPETSNDRRAEANPVAAEDSMEEESDGAQAQQELARIRELEAERTRLLGKLARAQADLANLRRRTEQEIGEVRKFANQIFAAELLRVIDSLDRALGAIPESLTGFAWIDGIFITRAQVNAVLKSQGIEPINATGEKFNPRYHEAVSSGDSPPVGEDAVVLEEYQRGYMIHDRVLRPTLVRAGSAGTSKSPDVPGGGLGGESEVETDAPRQTD